MRTTTTMDREFINSIISQSLLEDAIDFIKSNYDAEEVYGINALHDWAIDNGYVKEQ